MSEFAQKPDLPEVMPALCDPDDTAMELIHAKLVQTIYTNSDRCDYAIYRDRNHLEYKNEAGYRRNRESPDLQVQGRKSCRQRTVGSFF